MAKNISLIDMMMLALFVCFTSCTKKKSFTVTAEIDGLGAQIVSVAYYSRGGLQSMSLGSIDGRFAFKGDAPRPTLLSLTLPDGTVLATMVVENGDKMTIKGDVARPFDIEVKGNGDSEKIARWVKENAHALQTRDAAAINGALATWVGKNKSSKASTALMVTYFYTPGYEKMADSLMSMLSSGARAPEVVQNFTGILSAHVGTAVTAPVPILTLYDVSDSVVTVNPHYRRATLYCFTTPSGSGRDSICPAVKKLKGAYPASKFEAVEISTAADSAMWRQSLAGDSATWRRTWMPAAMASASIRPLSIPRVPYFIVADSAGTQLYRGSSIRAAAAAAESKLRTGS